MCARTRRCGSSSLDEAPRNECKWEVFGIRQACWLERRHVMSWRIPFTVPLGRVAAAAPSLTSPFTNTAIRSSAQVASLHAARYPRVLHQDSRRSRPRLQLLHVLPTWRATLEPPLSSTRHSPTPARTVFFTILSSSPRIPSPCRRFSRTRTSRR
jgi:hypothetical protein